MSARDKSRFTTAQAGWIALAVFAAWLAFLFFPFDEKAPQAAVHSTSLLDGEEELRSAGLRYNADWVGLPTYFKAWAPQLDWSSGSISFGYWNPGLRNYSYQFAASRTQHGYRFRLISERSGTNENPEGLGADGMLPTHPFQFAEVAKVDPIVGLPPNVSALEAKPPAFPAGKPKVDVQMKSTPLQVPEPELKTNDVGKN